MTTNQSLTVDDQTFLLIFSVGLTIFSSYQAYIAWRKPERHQEYMKRYATLFTYWPFGADKFWQSEFGFWVARLLFTLGMLLGIGLLIALAIGLIP